jgi:thioredoxin-related protein
MKRQLIVLLLILPATVFKSFSQGITFKTNMSWAAVKQQAQKENKYIFVDVGATFCAPCHMMEKEVFTKDNVADFYNKNFINVKLQANKTPNDDAQVKSWYKDAELILKQYAVTAYPAYLFFSPQGEVVYRYGGSPTPDQFIAIGKSALNPELSVNAQIATFENHQMKIGEEGKFAMFLTEQGNNKEAQLVAKDYNTNFLNKADDSVLKSASNLIFISRFQFLLVPGDKYFKLFYNDGLELDTLMKYPGHSYRLTNRIITMTEVWNRIYENGTKTIKDPNPDWDNIRSSIVSKYSADRADRILPIEKYRFYIKAVDWPLAIKSGNELLKNPLFNAQPAHVELMNQVAYNAYEHGSNKADITPATKWTQLYLEHAPTDFAVTNTYACLLYKLGEKKKAIDQAQRSIDLLKQTGERYDQERLLPVYEENLHKMKDPAAPQMLKRTIYQDIAF